MTFAITDQSVIDTIKTAYNNKQWGQAYQLVFDAITDTTQTADGDLQTPALEVDNAVWLWISGARFVNSGSGAFAGYIRNYTAEQYFLRTGEILDTSTDPSGGLQLASDLIAKRFIVTLFGVPVTSDPNEFLPDRLDDYSPTSLTLPSLRTIGLIDAGAAAAKIFPDLNYSPWAGTVLFTQLGNDAFFKQWVLTIDTNDFKKEPGTYDLATVAKATTDQFTLGFAITALLTDFSTSLNVNLLGASARADAITATNTFFGQTYGVSPDVLDVGDDIFSASPIQRLFNSATYIVGSPSDDENLQSVDGAEFLNAGQGNDTILGSYDVAGSSKFSVIDGGAGTDTIDYSSVTRPMKITFENAGTLGVRADVDKDPNGLDHKDYVYEVEKYKLGSGPDTVIIQGSADLANLDLIDAGANPSGTKDILDLSAVSGSINFANGKLTGTGFSVQFDNFEEVVLNSQNDKINLWPSIQLLYAGDGNDVVQSYGQGTTIDLGGGDDTLVGAGGGTTVITGDGHDVVELSHHGQIEIMDASTIDRITNYGYVLTGGIRWAGSEDVYAYGIHGERYGRNHDGDLVIEDATGNQTFVKGFNFAVDGSPLTAGISVVEASFTVIGYTVPNAPLRSNVSITCALQKLGQALYGTPISGAVDPLVLDLDGDGIELSAQEASGVSFDIDKDGFAEKVGWVRGGDGILVRDLNGNGRIDDIGEMFGSRSSSGFADLSALDGNGDGKVSALDNGLADFNGDGVVDSSDTFGALKVWIDANEDGKTDPGELRSLDSLGIVSISVDATATNTTVAGNAITAAGSFERADGSAGTVADVQLKTDNFNTTWLGDSSISEAAASRPNLKGFGTLTDLRVAMTLDPDLISIVDAALPSLNAISLAALRAAARPILQGWAAAVPVPAGTPGTETQQDFYFVGDTNQQGAVVYDFLVERSDTQGTYYAYASGQPVYDSQQNVINRPTLADILASQPQQGEWQSLSGSDISFFERFTGSAIGLESGANATGGALSSVSDGLVAATNELNKLAVRLAAQGPLASFFAGIVYDAQTDLFRPTTDYQLSPMLEAIFSVAPSTEAGAAAFIGQWKDIINVMLPDFQRDDEGRAINNPYLFQNLVAAYEDVSIPLTIQQTAALFDIPSSLIKTGSGTVVGDDNGPDIFYLDASNQTLLGGGGQDAYIVGKDFGHDVIQDVWQGLGNNQEDSIRFAHLNPADLSFQRDGLDLLISQIGTDNQIRVVDEFAGRRMGFISYLDFDKTIEIVEFANGTTWDKLDIARAVGMTSYATNDTLIGSPDVDYLNGGLGNDYMSGGNDGDHYIFGRGDGHDTIEDKQTYFYAENPDFVEFGDGIAESDLIFTRQGNSNDLQIQIAGTDDILTIKGQFEIDYNVFNSTPDRIEYFTFADGTYIDWEDIIQRLDATAGTNGDDIIYGFSYADVLDGGKGNDFLSGGNENDTYIFGRGYGSDTIKDNMTSIFSGGDDKVVFKPDIAVDDVLFHRDSDSNDLLISIKDSTDTLTIEGQFDQGGSFNLWFDRIESFEFATGEVITYDQVYEKLIAQAETAGDDTIYGFNSRDDILAGGLGNDILNGGTGSDTYLYARGDGNDTIIDGTYGAGTDRLVFSDVNAADVALVRNGNDVTIVIPESGPSAGDAGSILLKDEFNGLYNQAGIEQVLFADGTIWTRNDLQAKILSQAATDGNDVINGFNTDDTIRGGKGDDFLSGKDGADTYIYSRGDGNDVIDDQGSGPNTLVLQEIDPSDVTVVHNGNDAIILIGLEGVDGRIVVKGQLSSGAIASIQFDDGTAWSDQYIAAHTIANDGATVTHTGTPGNDLLIGTSDIDVFDGGLGDDVLVGFDGSDFYRWGTGRGNDTIVEYAGAPGTDTVSLVNLNIPDVAFGRTGDDLSIRILTTGEILKVQNQFQADGAGVEQVQFADNTIWDRAQIAAASWLVGTDNAETIVGTSGNDTIDGRGGNDFIAGGAGNDTYVFGIGSGSDTISEGPAATGGDADTLKIVALNSADVEFSRSSNDLKVKIISSGETATVQDQFNGTNGIEQVLFADGTVWDRNAIAQAAWYRGTAGNDIIYGSPDNDVLYGGGGDDYLQGGAGSDVYVYAADQGNDRISDGSDATSDIDTLRLTNLNAADITLSRVGETLAVLINSTGETISVSDQFYSTIANWGIEQIEFADGSSWGLSTIRQNAWVRGTAGADSIVAPVDSATIDAGQGNDTITLSGSGSDKIVFAHGDGHDVLDNTGSGYVRNDTIELTDIVSSDVRLTRSGDALFLDMISTGDQIKVNYQFYNGPPSVYGINYIDFADGVVFGRSDILAATSSSGGQGVTDDIINGTYGADYLDGHGGNDVIHGFGGADTFVFNRGYGHLEIDETDYNTNNVNTLVLGAGISPSDVKVTHSSYGGDLILNIGNNGDQIKVDQMLSSSTYSGIRQLQFADGSIWSHQDLLMRATTGTSGNDELFGTGDADIIDGHGGNDIVHGRGGADTFEFNAGYGQLEIDETDYNTSNISKLVFGAGITAADVRVTHSMNGNDIVLNIGNNGDQIKIDQALSSAAYSGIRQVQFGDGTTWSRQDLITKETTGGTGNDELFGTGDADIIDGHGGNDIVHGRGGADTFVFNAGYGQLEIDETDYNTSNISKLVLGSGITTSNLSVTHSAYGDALILNIGSNGDQIKIDQMLSSPTYSGIRQLQFADGSIWSSQTLLMMATVGTTGNDELFGTGNGDTFDGRGGNDVVHGRGGTDTFAFNSGYGHLEIDETDYNTSNISTLSLGAGISGADLKVTHSMYGNNLILNIGDEGDQIQIDQMLSSPTYSGIRQIKFADGSTWDHTAILDSGSTFTWTGSSSNAVLSGNNYGYNIFVLGDGTESVTGGARNNVYQASANTGQASLILPTAAGSNNELDFSTGITDQNLWFAQNGNDLDIELLGSNTKVAINNWFSGGASQLQEVTAGGMKIDSQISQLVQAMATYSSANPGFDPTSSSIQTLPSESGLQNAVAASWHS